MQNKIGNTSVIIAFSAVIALCMLQTPVFCAKPGGAGSTFESAYRPCDVPTVVSAASKPNVLVNLDQSGSMQLPLHFSYLAGYYWDTTEPESATDPSFVLEPNSLEDVALYDPTQTYYGFFDSALFYRYVPANPVKVTGNIYRNAGDYFCEDTVCPATAGTATWSGNFLNWAIMSRMDAALIALIGGKAIDPTKTSSQNAELGETCQDDSTECYIQSVGMRKGFYVRDASWNYQARVYVRPARPASEDNADDWLFPDNYKTGHMNTKDMFVTIMGYHTGKLDSSDPRTKPSVGVKDYSEAWKFQLIEKKKVFFVLDGSFLCPNGTPADNIISLYSGTATDSKPGEPNFLQSWISGTELHVEIDLEPGYYWIEVTNESDCNAVGTYKLWATADLTPQSHVAHNGTLSPIKAAPSMRVRLKTDNLKRRGMVQNTWDQIRWGFMYYKGVYGAWYSINLTDDIGVILSPCGDLDTPTDFVNLVEGRRLRNNVPQPFPYSGTPTGEAMLQAWAYFANGYDASGLGQYWPGWLPKNINNLSAFPDPYKDDQGNKISCRKSHILLISDGGWAPWAGGPEGNWPLYGEFTVDPVKPAYYMHTKDLRDDIGEEGSTYEKQTVTTLSFYTFN
ncbi:hypothetical protein ACFL2Q_16935, partial [Thermodesulfobacteriota bacterium]